MKYTCKFGGCSWKMKDSDCLDQNELGFWCE